MTIQPDPTGAQPGAPVSGTVTWTFEVVPQTNMQSFRTTIRSENGWLPITLTSSTSMIPGNTPPAQISTQGEYDSPRGCRGTFGSFATAEARSIQGSITGVDCPVPFTGSVTLDRTEGAAKQTVEVQGVGGIIAVVPPEGASDAEIERISREAQSKIGANQAMVVGRCWLEA